MRRGAEANGLRAQIDEAVIVVDRFVVQRYLDGHGRDCARILVSAIRRGGEFGGRYDRLMGLAGCFRLARGGALTACDHVFFETNPVEYCFVGVAGGFWGEIRGVFDASLILLTDGM